ncbi:MAG: hypothetical protein NTW41_09110 [Verrucomicrobia bacterium]|nr:hypothetical protein [Verrucomicrobiota bacterium]
MKRRDFLSLLGLSAGSVLIPAPVARLIRETCVLGGQPLISPPRSSKSSIIYAVNEYGDYHFHFGDPNAEPPLPTWEEFIDSRCVDLRNDKERSEFLQEYFGWDPSEGEPEPEIPLNEPIDGWAEDFSWSVILKCTAARWPWLIAISQTCHSVIQGRGFQAIRLDAFASSRAPIQARTSPM